MHEQIKHLEEELPGAGKSMEGQLGSKERLEALLPISLDELELRCKEDEDLKKLFNKMIDSFCDYFKTLVDLTSVEQRRGQMEAQEYRQNHQESDEAKRIIHDGLIVDVNALAMSMKMKGVDNSWIVPLRPGGDTNRAAYGRFALISIYLKLLEYEQ